MQSRLGEPKEDDEEALSFDKKLDAAAMKTRTVKYLASKLTTALADLRNNSMCLGETSWIYFEDTVRSAEQLSAMIRRAGKYYRLVTVAVDALDECNETRDDLFRFLRELGETPGFSVFLTSRKEYDIDTAFRTLPSISLNDLRDQIEVDMKAYISDEFQKR